MEKAKWMLILVLFALYGAALAHTKSLPNQDPSVEECKSVVNACSLGEVCSPSKLQNYSTSYGKKTKQIPAG